MGGMSTNAQAFEVLKEDYKIYTTNDLDELCF
jgi:hypothetical protein